LLVHWFHASLAQNWRTVLCADNDRAETPDQREDALPPVFARARSSGPPACDEAAPDSPQAIAEVTQEMTMTFTGMPTVAKLYVQRATVKDWRTHPCEAG
jgi:hypothetical protein